MKTFKITTHSATETQNLGKRLASKLSGGNLLSLTGDLGAGKTCFTQGLAKGLGIQNPITSPTFNLIKEYKGRMPFYHFDVYRLKSLSELVDLGYEEYFYSDGVTAIEWGDRVRELLPPDYLEVRFERSLEETTREIEAVAHGTQSEEIVKEWLKD